MTYSAIASLFPNMPPIFNSVTTQFIIQDLQRMGFHLSGAAKIAASLTYTGKHYTETPLQDQTLWWLIPSSYVFLSQRSLSLHDYVK